MMANLGMRRLQKVILAQHKCRNAQIWEVKSDSIADQSSKRSDESGESGRADRTCIGTLGSNHAQHTLGPQPKGCRRPATSFLVATEF